jgi:hypothetical protein
MAFMLLGKFRVSNVGRCYFNEVFIKTNRERERKRKREVERENIFIKFCEFKIHLSEFKIIAKLNIHEHYDTIVINL